MKRLIVVLTLILMAGVAQQALSEAPKGVWGCPAGVWIDENRIFQTYLRFSNWSDQGSFTIQDIKIYDENGNPLPVTFSSIVVGKHQRVMLRARDLLGYTWADIGTYLGGLQAIVKWKATWSARPAAVVVLRWYARDPVTGVVLRAPTTERAESCRDME